MINVVYTDAYETERSNNFENASGFVVEDGILYVSDSQGNALAAYAPGHWRKATHEVSTSSGQ